jgi:hypothetical protein
VSRATTAREAVIAELIGDITELLDRMATLTPALNDSRLELADTAAGLAACIEPIKAHVSETVTQAQKAAVEHIARRTREMAFESYCAQTRAMEEAARRIFEEEVGPPLRKPAETLKVLVERTRRPQWETWATYAATGAVSATFAMTIAIYFLHR